MKNRTLIAAAGAALTIAAGSALAADAGKAEALLKQHNCVQCHGIDKKIIGPAYKDVAKKYKGQKDAAALLAKRVKAGSKGVWGPVPMPPNAAVSDGDIRTMVDYVLSL
jgi:cytochrome c